MADPWTGAHVIAWHSFEGWADGADITTGGSGSGDPWSSRQLTGASTMTAETTDPLCESVSALIVVNAGFAMVRWHDAVIGIRTTMSFAMYVDFTSLPTGYTPILGGYTDDTATADTWSIRISSTGNIRLSGPAATTVASGTIPITTSKGGAGWRIEGIVNHTTGAYTVEWFDGHSTTRVGFFTGTHSSGATGFGATGSTRHVRALGMNSAIPFTAKFDDIGIGTAKLGPRAITNQLPIANAGADKLNAQPTVPTSLTGTDSDPDGTVTARRWQVVTKYPASMGTVTLTGSTSATCTVTVPEQGAVLMGYDVQDNLGDWSTQDTAMVYALGTAIKVIAVTSGTGGVWSDVGDSVTSQSDASNSTYGQSNATSSSPSRRRYRLAPMPTPTAVSIVPTVGLNTAGAFTSAKVKLYEGATMRKEWSFTPTTTPTALTPLTMTGGEIATVTSWVALDLEYEFTL